VTACEQCSVADVALKKSLADAVDEFSTHYPGPLQGHRVAMKTMANREMITVKLQKI
jgi:hypothetical protein